MYLGTQVIHPISRVHTIVYPGTTRVYTFCALIVYILLVGYIMYLGTPEIYAHHTRVYTGALIVHILLVGYIP